MVKGEKEKHSTKYYRIINEALERLSTKNAVLTPNLQHTTMIYLTIRLRRQLLYYSISAIDSQVMGQCTYFCSLLVMYKGKPT